MKRFLPKTFFVITIIGFCFTLLSIQPFKISPLATHVVISEIQIAGINGVNDEFIELYNPTDTNISLNGWRLTKKNSSGVQNNLVLSLNGEIPARGYFLIAHSASYSASATADFLYSAPSQNIAANNTVILYSDAGSTVVDIVGMGNAVASESATFPNPPSGSSLERKANLLSDPLSMNIGGIDEFLGNGQDTDNNSLDFVTRSIPEPQNTKSNSEPTPSPTLTPTPTITPTPILTPTFTPTPTPTITPSPALTPTLTPTQIPSPTTTPNISLTPTPTPRLLVNNKKKICYLKHKPHKFWFVKIFIPYLDCNKR